MTAGYKKLLGHNSSPIEHAKGKILLIACGALANEILALIKLNGWQHMALTCLPAILHNSPNKITGSVRDCVAKYREKYQKIFVVYADCGTGGLLKAACEDMGVEMIAGPHCYSFYEGITRFSETYKDEITAFYLTDFLVRQFETFFWEPMGLDRHPELLKIYFAHYTKLVYQAQTNDPELTRKAKVCAQRLGLAFERRYTGYGDLEVALNIQAM